jgi:hypothetical protein
LGLLTGEGLNKKWWSYFEREIGMKKQRFYFDTGVFFHLFFAGVFIGFSAMVFGNGDPNEPYANVTGEGGYYAPAATSAYPLPFDPYEYHFLIYESSSSENRIRLAMEKIGITVYTVCDRMHPVTTELLNSHDILIVGWDSSSSTANKDGLVTSAIEQGITGRVILSGHDSDYHTVMGPVAAELFFIQEIDYVLKGGGTGMVVCADPQAFFAWLPESWGVVCNQDGGGATISSFTQDGLDSGIYDDLTPTLMSNWGQSYHNTFASWGTGFKVFERGTNDQHVVTIAASTNPRGFIFTKTDDVPDSVCLGVDDEIAYTISWDCPVGYTVENALLIDRLPAGATFLYELVDGQPAYEPNEVFDPNLIWQWLNDPNFVWPQPEPLPAEAGIYDPQTHTILWALESISAESSGSVSFKVRVNDTSIPGGTLHNIAELWSDETLLVQDTEDTAVCCWDTTGIIYTDVHASSGGNGTSWALAFNNLQDALSRARTTDCAESYTLYCTQGVYSPGSNEQHSFILPENIALYGGFPPGGCDFTQRNPDRYKTILSGKIDVTRRNNTVVRMGNNTVLDGFTVTESKSTGQGIYGSGVDFSVANSIIAKNLGYGAHMENCNAVFQWCNFRQNDYDGIRHTGAGKLLVLENVWVRQSGRYGAYCLNSIPIIVNSILSESDMSLGGRAGLLMENPTDRPYLQNVTCSHNFTDGIALMGAKLPEIYNSIVYHNGGEALAGFSADQAAYYSIIEDCNSVNYNINADPEFAYFDPNNVRLSYGSPAINSGNPYLDYGTQLDMDGRQRILGASVDRGAYEIDCEDVSNVLWDKNADGIVNLFEFNRLAKFWLAHDPNDPAIADPNHPDHEYLTDPNSAGYITPASLAAWYPDGHTFNYVATGISQYSIDLADLLYWLDEAPWLWAACWRTDILPPEMMMAGGEMLRIDGFESMTLQTEAVPEKTALEQMTELANTIVQLENLWLTEPDIQQAINPDEWNRFMEAVYQNLLDLQTGEVRLE